MDRLSIHLMVESTATTSAAYYDYPVNEPSVDENTPYARALYDFQCDLFYAQN